MSSDSTVSRSFQADSPFRRKKRDAFSLAAKFGNAFAISRFVFRIRCISGESIARSLGAGEAGILRRFVPDFQERTASPFVTSSGNPGLMDRIRSEERRVGKECRSRW